MTNARRKVQPSSYEVGYRRPPVHGRFRRGASGNPGGRPRRMTSGRAHNLILQEAYRLVTVREGDKVLRLPAIQAVLRSQVALAAKGNGPAQRAVIAAVNAIEQIVSQAESPPQHITVSWATPKKDEAAPASPSDQSGPPRTHEKSLDEMK